jgi:hypothetical protein
VAEGYAGQVDAVAMSDEGIPPAEGIPPGDGVGPPGIIALIRPDAYVAWAAPWADGQRLEIRAALARWCGSA